MTTYRVVSFDETQQLAEKDYRNLRALLADYEQTGVEEDSYTLRLHGEPLLKGLIGPLSQPESKTVVRYETPEVFAKLTEEWAKQRKRNRRAGSRAAPVEEDEPDLPADEEE